MLKGSATPYEFFTIDIDLQTLDALPEEQEFKTIDRLTGADKKQFKINNKCKSLIFYDKLLSGKRTVLQCWDNDSDIKIITEMFKPEFYSEWNTGLKNYISGDWANAKKQFEKCLDFIPDYKDSPSQFLINYIEENEGTKVHKNWPLYRENEK